MKMTPMMEQYLGAKQQHPEAILFFRMGDFYEMFFEDATTASQAIGLTLTARNKGDADEVPMAGVPHHAADGYIAKLLEKGFAVAICEQLEDPKEAKGLVRRGVTRVITPGTVLDVDKLDERSQNFLAAVGIGQSKEEHCFGLAFVDASTGEFQVTEVQDVGELVAELSRVRPREIVVASGDHEVFGGLDRRVPGTVVRVVDDANFDPKTVLEAIGQGDVYGDADRLETTHRVDVETARGFFASVDRAGFRNAVGPRRAVAGVLSYLVYTQRGVSAHISQLQPYKVEDFLVIDESTRANLELMETLMGGRKVGSLLHAIDRTTTAIGARRLRSWLTYPLVDVVRVRRRHAAVGELKADLGKRDKVRELLGRTYDIERLTGKVTGGLANARDLVQLRSTLEIIPEVRAALKDSEAELLRIIADRLDPCEELRQVIDEGLVDDPPTGVKDGGLVREGFNAELDELISISRDGKDWLLRYETSERERTKISSLKVKYNKVFGYFIEISRANFHLVPDDYIRKQTLANAERFFTPALKEYEEKVLTAEDRRVEIEYQIFEEIRSVAATYVVRLRHVAYLLSTLDVLAGLAEVAHLNDYCCPEVDQTNDLLIEDGRHPVVEQTLKDVRFVPNSARLDCQDHQLLVITGPNMAGKSTVIRQVALITLMAQMGSFVPARSARIGMVDKVFSRVGASDNLARGHSTFMVEMTETAYILNNATSRSLIILDEIGRGTSTYDGLSIAWAVVEHLHGEIGAKTLFATHYHELTELAEQLPGVKNYNIACKEWKDDIIFLRKLVPGPANRSYGIQVGRLAGLPVAVVERAKEILLNLETADHDEGGASVIGRHVGGEAGDVGEEPQLNLLSTMLAGPVAPRRGKVNGTGTGAGPMPQAVPAHLSAVVDLLDGLSLDVTTPLDALNALYRLKALVRQAD